MSSRVYISARDEAPQSSVNIESFQYGQLMRFYGHHSYVPETYILEIFEAKLGQ